MHLFVIPVLSALKNGTTFMTTSESTQRKSPMHAPILNAPKASPKRPTETNTWSKFIQLRKEIIVRSAKNNFCPSLSISFIRSFIE